MPVPKSENSEKSYCLRRSGLDSDDSHCEKNTYEYIQPQERHAVRLHAARVAKSIGSDGCLKIAFFTMRNISGFCVSPIVLALMVNTLRNRFKYMNINYSWFCFKRGYWPRDLECPKCQKGFLNFHEDHFVQNETVVSKEMQSEYNSTEEPSFYEGWIEVVFSAKLTCSNDRCNEVVLMVGEGNTEWDREEDELSGASSDEFYRPSYFEPHLKPILIPAKCPDNARKALCQAFRVMFISFGLACNQLRVAIEYIVDDLLGCDEKMLERKDGKFVSLDKKIEKIEIKDNLKFSKEFLSAIKWLGNAGSHEVDALTLRDFIDALALIERILNDLYSDGGSESLEDIASHINENKKPRSRIKEA